MAVARFGIGTLISLLFFSYSIMDSSKPQCTSWLKSHGLTVTHTYPNHLLVDVTGTFAQIEQVFHVTINDYTMQLNGKQITFYSPANEPTISGSVNSLIYSIVGLDNYPRVHADNVKAHPTFTNGNAHGIPPYYPQDFANAYDVNPLWNLGDTGSNQHIGITLWGTPPSDAALNKFALKTGANVATQANGRLQVIQVSCTGSCYYNTLGGIEAGIDVESSSGMAPGATIDYYQAPTDQYGNPTDAGLEDALNQAGSDSNDNLQISSSWGECEASSISDPFTMQVEQYLQSNTATGHDYFFSSGDNGSACVFNPSQPCSIGGMQDPYPQYPASSAYATSVGGTTFDRNINGSYPGEVAWNYTPSTCSNGQGNPPEGSGGGYSKLFAQPSWQVGFSKNKHRGYPDVAADADPTTGALIWYDSSNGPTATEDAGTSLATPLWAGMIADVNQYIQSQGGIPLGFINPTLYEINGFHDITSGTNGPNGKYNAKPGWDAVTGLGSPDLYDLAQSIEYVDAAYAYSLSGVAAVSANDVWAVGDSGYVFDPPHAPDTTLIEQWDGSSWNAVPSPNPGQNGSYLTSVAAVSANDVWAVGDYFDSNYNEYTLIEQWNGSSWNVVPSPNPSLDQITLSSITAISSTDVWAVGSYYGSNDTFDTLIEQWDGSSWNVVPSPNPGDSDVLYGVTAISANDVWAVGVYSGSNADETLIEQWNGSSWNVISSPNPTFNSQLYGVAAVSSTDIWAVGYYGTSSYNYPKTLIEQWNGSTWNVVPSPNPGSSSPFDNQLSDVAAVSTSDIWAVGDYSNSQGGQDTLIEHWNGTKWKVVSSPNPGSNLYYPLSAVAEVSASDVWTVGEYVTPMDGYESLIEQWNGSSWNVVPSPNPLSVYMHGKS
jgi:hypothetical protein